MAIDLFKERVIPLRDYRDHVPSGRGKRMHRTTAYRHATRGVQGVKLEIIQLPSGMYTSLEAIQRFANRLTALSRREASPLPHATPRTEKRQTAVEREIAEIRSSLHKKGGR